MSMLLPPRRWMTEHITIPLRRLAAAGWVVARLGVVGMSSPYLAMAVMSTLIGTIWTVVRDPS